MERTARNYQAHGGKEWVIGGKLTFLPSAVVEGLDGVISPEPEFCQALHIVPNSKATSVSALREDFNRLLDALRKAGIIAGEEDKA